MFDCLLHVGAVFAALAMRLWRLINRCAIDRCDEHARPEPVEVEPCGPEDRQADAREYHPRDERGDGEIGQCVCE
jgi:hypothetical protein